MTRQFTLVKADAFQALDRLLVKDLATLLASTETYAAGDVVVTMTEGFRYEVVPSGAHLTTAGGAGLKVLPLATGAIPVAAFGVVTTTDNAALCAAAAAALPATGGTLVFPEGDFHIASPVDFDLPEDTTVLCHGTRFVCTHDGVAFDLNGRWDPVADAGTDANTKRRIYWHGGEFTNTAGTRSASEAIRARAMRQFVMREVYIEGFWAGVRFGAKDSYHFDRCYSYNCTYHYYNPATATVPADKLQNVSWNDCHISASGSENAVLLSDPLANVQWRGGSINAAGDGAQVLVQDSGLVLSEGISFLGLHIEQINTVAGIRFAHTASGLGFYGVQIGAGTDVVSATPGWKGLVCEYVRGMRVDSTVFRDGSGGASEQAISIDSDCRDVVIDTRSTQFLSVAAGNRIVLSAPADRAHVTLEPTTVPVNAGTPISGFNANAYSNGDTGTIDMSAAWGQFGGYLLPPKGYVLKGAVRDSGSAGATAGTCRLRLIGKGDNFFAAYAATAEGVPNNSWREFCTTVLADENGDITYDVDATGSGTMSIVAVVAAVYQ